MYNLFVNSCFLGDYGEINSKNIFLKKEKNLEGKD
jgi:hypothetical protein